MSRNSWRAFVLGLVVRGVAEFIDPKWVVTIPRNGPDQNGPELYTILRNGHHKLASSPGFRNAWGQLQHHVITSTF